MSRSIAVKCTYNDGDEGHLVGFKGTCSLDLLQTYVKRKDMYCGSEECPCHTYYFRDRLRGERPPFPCMESRLFHNWEVAASLGREPGSGSHQHLTETGPGAFAVLTTTFLGGLERERAIIGVFPIAKIAEEGREVRVVAAPTGRIRLPLEEARQLFFWAYCDTESHQPEWHQGLFRYMDEGQVHRILVDVAATVRDENTWAEIDRLIQSAFGSGPAPQAPGCLREKSSSRNTDVAQARKYGLGGEGQEHRKLKEWLLQHPEDIGIPDAIRGTAE